MFKQFLGYYFWFGQPSIILNQSDKLFGYIFAGLTALAIILRILARFSANPINRKLLMKFWHLGLTVGLGGLIWYAFRYENSQVLGMRFWAGTNIVAGIIWLLFILKYLIFNYLGEKKKYEREKLKSKYLPGNAR